MKDKYLRNYLSLKETWRLNALWDPGLDSCPQKRRYESIKIQIRSIDTLVLILLVLITVLWLYKMLKLDED